MRLKMILVAVSVLLLMAGTAFAGDVNGTWVAEREMPKRQGGAGGPQGGGGGFGGGFSGPLKWTFELKADGSKLSGTVQGPRGEPSEIQDGKIDGDKISFFVKASFMGREMKTTYEGTVSGDEISFKTTREGGMGRPGGGSQGREGRQRPERPPLVAKRQK